MVRNVGRSWLLERNPRDDRANEPVVTDQCESKYELKYALNPDVMRIFRRMWPGNENGDSDWHDDWHSFRFRNVDGPY